MQTLAELESWTACDRALYWRAGQMFNETLIALGGGKGPPPVGEGEGG